MTTGSSVIWEALGTIELSNQIKEIIYDSWRTKTKHDLKELSKNGKTIVYNEMKYMEHYGTWNMCQYMEH